MEPMRCELSRPSLKPRRRSFARRPTRWTLSLSLSLCLEWPSSFVFRLFRGFSWFTIKGPMRFELLLRSFRCQHISVLGTSTLIDNGVAIFIAHFLFLIAEGGVGGCLLVTPGGKTKQKRNEEKMKDGRNQRGEKKRRVVQISRFRVQLTRRIALKGRPIGMRVSISFQPRPAPFFLFLFC